MSATTSAMMSPTFALLGLAIACVWLPSVRLGRRLGRMNVAAWPFVYSLAVACAMQEGVVAIPAMIALAAFSSICAGAHYLALRRASWVWTVAAGIASLALALHLLPGFHNPRLVDAAHTSADALPFTLYANFDKGSVGLLLLAFFAPRVRSLSELRALVRPTAAAISATAAVALGVAWMGGYVRPEFKLPPFTGAFLFVNLFFTCVAEETFFRGLIQERIARAVAGRPHWAFVPLLVSAILFGLAHAGGGVLYVALATLAGVGYAVVYAQTRRVEAAVLTHFAVNAAHFVFFTYPGLAK